MNWQWSPYAIFQSITAIVCLAAAIFNWRRFRHLPAARLGTALLLLASWWIVGSLMEFISFEPVYRQFWNKIQFLAIVFLPPGWLIYAMRYIGVTFKPTGLRFLLLWFIPVLTLVLIYTNDRHGLFWSQLDFMISDSKLVMQTAVYGTAFWLFLAHAYLMVIAGFIILLRAFLESGRLYRWQVIGLTLVAFVPMIVSLASIFGKWRPLGDMDFTPFALGLMASVSGWVIYRLQMRDVTPVARHMMIEQMGDGVLVLNSEYGIIDLNPAAQNLLQQPKSQLQGRSITQFWPDWPHNLPLDDPKAGGRQMEWTLKGSPARTFDLHVTPLLDGRNRLVSRIVVLRDIGQHKKIEAQLKSSLHEKEALLKEIHHRVKNNLQIISSLLNLQATQSENKAVHKALQEGQSRVRSMALIHEILYRSDDLARIDFGAYIQELTTQLCQTYNVYTGQVVVDVQMDEVFLTMETALPCGLILNELVSNALKHAFADGRSGQITICLLAKNNHQYNLNISDNGIGFPPHLNYRQTTTLGLQLVNTLIDQLEGNLEVTSQKGASFTITFEDKTPKETS